jgi:hypothetical protein
MEIGGTQLPVSLVGASENLQNHQGKPVRASIATFIISAELVTFNLHETVSNQFRCLLVARQGSVIGMH